MSGCWVVEGVLTTGESIDGAKAFNTFFLPHAVADGSPPGAISYDTDYTLGGNSQGPSGEVPVDWTFDPASHPCTSVNFDASNGDTQEVSTCCITNMGVGEAGEGGPLEAAGWTSGEKGGFLANYRPMKSFVQWSALLDRCTGPNGQVIDRPGYNETEHDVTVDISFPADHMEFLSTGDDNWGGGGQFSGLNHSGVTNLTLLDPFSGQYYFTMELDEVELRGYAGRLAGTIGIEHTIDTFIGFANFRPTGMHALDTFVTQQNLHLEKTNFFTVSTEGVNAYTFLRYVNLRLISTLVEDDDFSGQIGPNTNDDEALNRTIRTDRSSNVNYVQVTFVVGDQFGVNNQPSADPFTSGLIPLESVRVGLGTFVQETVMVQACDAYEQADAAGFVGLPYAGIPVNKSTFDWTVNQDCGPQSVMCASPSQIPDKFVSYNIPLGSQVFDETEESDLSKNVFVHMVINAIDEDARADDTDPNGGEDPWQVKTVLTASVPIVEGGINIFCDALIAKTDLLDVASADLLIGTTDNDNATRRRSDLDGYSRRLLEDDLIIIEDIGTTDLNPAGEIETETDSLESSIMTLVLDGDPEVFDAEETLLEDDIILRRRSRRARRALNGNTMGYSLSLDDMFTIHLMEDGRAPPSDLPANDTSIAGTVQRLMAAPGDDNQDDFGLQTEGYLLNGAFRMVIRRDLDPPARLEPTPELLQVCPITPTRPDPTSTVLEVCITRREISSRNSTIQIGADGPTSVEVARPDIPPDASTAADVVDYLDSLDPTDNTESNFMAMALGDSTYSRELGIKFARAIVSAYGLNGRFRRAFWVNPAFEWTPSMTGGGEAFTLSQRVYLFALITLDEGIDRRRGVGARRMLLQSSGDGASPLKNSGNGLGSANIYHSKVTTRSMMANSWNVPTDRVGIFDVELQLAREVACLEAAARQNAVRLLLNDYVADTASSFHTVQVLSVKVEMNGEQCSRRRTLKGADLSAAVAKVAMLVVFEESSAPSFEFAAFEELPGVLSVESDENNSPSIVVSAEEADIDDQDRISYVQEKDDQDDEESGGLSQGALVGICAGVAGVVVLVVGIAGFVYLRKQNEQSQVQVVEAVDVRDLKASLGDLPYNNGTADRNEHVL